MQKKHLSSVANDVIQRCAQELQISVDVLIKEFEAVYEPVLGEYSRKLIEYCSSRALTNLCATMHENVSDGSFSRFTFDMMLAWQTPDSTDEELKSESVAKENTKVVAQPTMEDEIPLFYSDIMPLLVDHDESVNEDAFVWLALLVPLAADAVNGRFTFETLTVTTGHRLHFPAYDKFLKEIDKCIKLLQTQATPAGVELADDEFILHVEGTAGTQRVVRHIGGTSWPGRLTLTNYAIYFEASGVVSYESALKMDLSKETEQSVKPAATGPWGAPLFDKAIEYESSELQQSVVLEFPEMTSSTRRDHWLALVKEIILLHRFLAKSNLSPVEEWEMHARTILGIIRLHAAREMLRISPPVPRTFLIFTLCDELPKGDFVLEELGTSLKNIKTGHPCSGSTVLRSLITASQVCMPRTTAVEKISDSNEVAQTGDVSSLESTVNQVHEESREMDKAKATVEGLKDEGVIDSAQVLLGLIKPLYRLIPLSQEILGWERLDATISVIVIMIAVVYKEWVGKAIAVMLLLAVAHLLWARRMKIGRKQDKIVICTASDKPAMENIVSAQQGLRTLHEMTQYASIAILKLWSIITSRSPKHTNDVILVMSISAFILAAIPFKLILIGTILYSFIMTSKLGMRLQNEQGNRRLKEWWDSIPVVPVELVDELPDSST